MNKRRIIIEHWTLKFNHFFGSPHALLMGLGVIAIWAISCSFKSHWHSSIVEFIAIISFFNIFIVQRAQNKGLKAVQLKLDELLASSNRASNLLIKAEDAPEHVLEQVQGIYKDLAKATGEDASRQSIASAAVDHIMETAILSAEEIIISTQRIDQ